VEIEEIEDKVYIVEQILNIHMQQALELKSLKVSEDTHTRLTKHGKYGESMDKIINKILDVYEGKTTKK
jgi:hypothetical protein